MKSIFLILSLLLSFSIFAEPKKEKTIEVQVKGMVCAFCAQGIEKNFKGIKAVKETKVDLDTMIVKITLKEGQSLKEEKISEIITDAGFSFVGIKK